MEDMTIFIKEATNQQPIEKLETILMEMEGIERALIDVTDGELKISYNERKIALEQIKQKIMEHGFHSY